MELRQEKIYGLIGYPLGHSFSQEYFNQKFAAEHIDAKYLNFELPDIGDLMEVVAEYPDLAGLNVTIPYKEQVLPYLDEIDEEAKTIGAVNVIRVTWHDDEPHFKGYNSDVIGFRDSLRPMLTPQMTHALILGTGGAAKAVAEALNTLGIDWLMVSRKRQPDNPKVITYADLTPEVMAANLLIVNCTPVGMYPHIDDCPDIPYYELTPNHLCYDLLYNPDVTKFMRLAAEQGAQVKNGLEMLLLQAYASWVIWNS